jgi:CheY-like chemotaxis protein
MKKISIMWVDDEIDLLKPHILFLEQKGYLVVTASNGNDAIDLVLNQSFELIFLDENMPGLSGLETLNKIKNINPSIPVVMITKSEEEDIMDAAIGSKIADYLIKPVNPNQILLSIKKNIDSKRLVTEKTTMDYQSEFSHIGVQINQAYTFNDWIDLYKKLIFWELEIDKSSDPGLRQVLQMQKEEANSAFAKFIKTNYLHWFDSKRNASKPVMSPNIFKNTVFPLLDNGLKVFFILIDNLRYDQWKALLPLIEEFYSLDKEEIYCSILPTATQYARNSVFAGLMPLEIEKIHPGLWTDEEDESESMNQFESELITAQLIRNGHKEKFHYEKIINPRDGRKLVDNLSYYLNDQLTVVVYNFVDMLSHSKTEMDMIKELASDEAAYRSLTKSWFQHSPLFDFFKELSSHDVKLIITTDHGTVRVNNPLKVIGDKKTSTNLRFKQGKNLSYNPKEVFEIKDPSLAHLPKNNVSSTYIFGTGYNFLVYPNNYNYYVNYYRNTFQHGGISLEEMLVPLITLSPKR